MKKYYSEQLKGIDPDWQFPRFEITEFYPKKTKYCLVIYTLNEGNHLIKELEKTKKYSKLLDVIVADWGSNDGSTSPKILKKNNVRTLLTKLGSGNLSAQMRMSFVYACSKNYKGVVLIDGNNKDNPKSIPNFIEKLDFGYDYIQGSRFVKGGKGINTPLERKLALRLIHAPLISIVSGFHYTDTTNGFRAYSTKFLMDKRVKLFRNIFSDYELHYYLSLKAPKLGFNVIEIPTERKYPKGKVPTKINKISGYIKILKQLFGVLIGMYDPK